MIIVYILICLIVVDILLTVYKSFFEFIYKQKTNELSEINTLYYKEIMSLRMKINELQKELNEPSFKYKTITLHKNNFKKIKAVEVVNRNTVENFNSVDYHKIITDKLSNNILNEIKHYTHIKENFDETLNSYVYSCEFWVYEE